MRREEQFDSFYHATRRALVHQTFALTGDLQAAQSAVRDAYVAAWHHWRKVSSMDDPQDWVRPLAWHLAQRRHSARIWRRNKAMSSEDTVILDAFAKLTLSQRRTLLLTELAALSLSQAAREMAVPLATAEQSLQSGIANFAVNLDVDSTSVRTHLLSLAEAAGEAQLPRASIIRRAGKKRRRSHTAIAAAVVVVVAIASGAFAHDPGEVPDTHLIKPPNLQGGDEQLGAQGAIEELPTAAELLDEDQITRLGLNQLWAVTDTHDNTSGPGVNTICQQTRFADPDGISALVRTFQARGNPSRSAVQTIEISKSVAQAKDTFATTVGWYAGCRVGRLQLLTAYEVNRIGDQAHVLMVRVWEKPVTTYSIAVSRVGQITTSTVGETVGGPPPPPSQISQSLADSVAMLCAGSGAENCSRRPTTAVVPPPPSGEELGILAVVDLPPVGRIEEPWVGTEAGPAPVNPSATTCDRANFMRQGASKTRARTFLIPEAKLPDRFGLSETYGVFASARVADLFLGNMRRQLNTCEDRDLATQVRHARSDRDGSTDTELSTWDLETEVSDKESVLFRLGFVRVGNKVAQVNFSPAHDEGMSPRDFRALVVRAGERLRELD